jgi:hypothetical protein
LLLDHVRQLSPVFPGVNSPCPWSKAIRSAKLPKLAATWPAKHWLHDGHNEQLATIVVTTDHLSPEQVGDHLLRN